MGITDQLGALSLAVLVSLLASGCANIPGLYAEVGAGYKIERTTSYVLRPGCHVVISTDRSARNFASCGGDNPTAHLSVGFEFKKPYRCEWHHLSHYFDGGMDRETHLDEIRCLRKWGGR